MSFLATRIAYAAVVRYAAGMPSARIFVNAAAVAITSGGVFSQPSRVSGKHTSVAATITDKTNETISAPYVFAPRLSLPSRAAIPLEMMLVSPAGMNAASVTV